MTEGDNAPTIALAATIWKLFAKPPRFFLSHLPLAMTPRTKISLHAALSLDSLADLSDLFGIGIAALCTATWSRENTNSNPDTDPRGKSQDVTQGMVLAANLSSQQARRVGNVLAYRLGSPIRLLQNIETRSKKCPQSSIHVSPFDYRFEDYSLLTWLPSGPSPITC